MEDFRRALELERSTHKECASSLSLSLAQVRELKSVRVLRKQCFKKERKTASENAHCVCLSQVDLADMESKRSKARIPAVLFWYEP